MVPGLGAKSLLRHHTREAPAAHAPNLEPQTPPQVRKRKWDNYSSGSELFGLAVTRFPELEQTEKEVGRGLGFGLHLPALQYSGCTRPHASS